MDVNDLKTTVKTHFSEYWKHAEACLATIATLLLKDNADPTSLVLIGQASTGKTTVLDLFRGVEGVTYSSDYFTPKAFVSHYADKKKDVLKDIDLLKRIIGKCLIVPDLGVIFAKRKEDVADNLGILTRVLDGNGLSTDSGVHGNRAVTGDCMMAMLGATTPFGYKIWDEMGKFGSRLLFMHMPVSKKDSLEIAEEFKTDLVYKKKRERCQGQAKGFLESLWAETGGFRSIEWNDKEIPQDVLQIVIELAKLLAKLRTMIPKLWRDRDGDFQHQPLLTEGPRRAVSLLLNMAKGRAIIYGRNQINTEDILLLIDITLSSCPEDRGRIFRKLVKEDVVSLEDICKLLNVGVDSAEKMLANLCILGIAEKVKDNFGVERPDQIKIADEVAKSLQDSRLEDYFAQVDDDIYS